MVYNFFHTFQKNKKYYVYDYHNYYLMKISKAMYEILNNIKTKKLQINEILDEDIKKKVTFLYNKNLFISGSNPEERKVTEVLEKNKAYFSFPTVHACNLRCKYCFAEHGENYIGEKRKCDEKTIRNILEYVCYDIFKDYNSYRVDFINGGEPLLNIEAIKCFIASFKKMYSKNEKKLELFLCTNGTIYDENIWKLLDDNHFNLGVSIETDKKIHDSLRPFADGMGSYDIVVDTIKRIKNSNNYSNRLKDIWTLSVLNNENKDICKIVDNCMELGIKRMQVEWVHLSKNHTLSINKNNIEEIIEAYKQLIDIFREDIKQDNYSRLILIINNNDYLGKYLKRIILGEYYISRCFAGRNKISFDCEGNIYPCESFVGNVEYKIGDIYNGIDKRKREEFVNCTVQTVKKCAECWCKFICGGDCRYNSYLVNGTIYEPDEVFCQYAKSIIEELLVFVSEMSSLGKLDALKSFISKREAING